MYRIITNCRKVFSTCNFQNQNYLFLFLVLSDELRAHILEVPYKGGNMSMYFLLPPFASQDGVGDILAALKKDPTTFKRFTEDSHMLKPVEISIPKFSLTQDLNLVPVSP